MSRVHEALRRAGQAYAFAPFGSDPRGAPAGPSMADFLALIPRVPYAPSPDGRMGGLMPGGLMPGGPITDGLITDAPSPHQPAGEEFRTVRTRLNHMQGLRSIHTVIVTSPAPAEGKSFVAANLALSEAQLDDNLTLLCDFDFRRPVMHSLFGTDRAPGISDYLQGLVPLHAAMRRMGDTNFYVMPAGAPVINPLELLSLKEAKRMLDRLASLFNWIILDSPPLLVAADANLLSTLCDGTVLVARIGATTVDSITRAMQSLCQNNVLGIIVNGARRGELYGKYSYYRSCYSGQDAALEANPPE